MGVSRHPFAGLESYRKENKNDESMYFQGHFITHKHPKNRPSSTPKWVSNGCLTKGCPRVRSDQRPHLIIRPFPPKIRARQNGSKRNWIGEPISDPFSPIFLARPGTQKIPQKTSRSDPQLITYSHPILPPAHPFYPILKMAINYLIDITSMSK